LDHRSKLSLGAWNHVARDPHEASTAAKAKRLIAKRWKHPRFNCCAAIMADGGFIGWHKSLSVPRHVQLRLMFDHNGGRFRSPSDARRFKSDLFICWFPDQLAATNAIWDVIEHNGLVRRIFLAPDAEQEPHSNVWHQLVPSASDLVRRRRPEVVLKANHV
jgi:hypothetical protein